VHYSTINPYNNYTASLTYMFVLNGWGVVAYKQH